MLKLVKLYSNKESEFPSIFFHDGINVIYARITKNEKSKDSHSLGKSTLADLIDYMLIKKITKNFFLKKPQFINFIFYLEVQASQNLFITIQRAVSGKISLSSSKESTNLIEINNASLIGENLIPKEAKKNLNEILKLNIVNNALGKYRNGLRYCIRHQDEYTKIFKVKTHNEKDVRWKPYLSGLLGISADLVTGKYNANARIKTLETTIAELKTGVDNKSKGALEASINNLENKTSEMSKELNTISFQKIDESITRELVEGVGSNIASINQEIYSHEQKISNINKSLEEEFNYDISNIKEIFNSIEINLPKNLIRTYDELIELNKSMGKDRRKHLKNAKKSLSLTLEGLNKKKGSLSKKQEELSQLLLDKEAFKKFQALQKILIKDESNLATLKERLKQLDTTISLRKELETARIDATKTGLKIEELCSQSNNKTLKGINKIFSYLIKESININASFYIETNKYNNIEFKANTDDGTSIDEGFSYTKVFSVCFDIALLVFYSSKGYYRFSYHDGIFESLDDRVKLRLIKALRKLAEQHGLQFIITILDSDIPENKEGSKIHFIENEIIKELSDKGKEGRLFKMDMF
ncbi:hypothetical protein BSPLISOX_346 [uncultured Gammaproteobacteria bacterium]|jgi:uncharacterized protein YydD (DUF2326 family)|nr:hypothetical protein [uncultured Gammaproteobacteria bacterium]VVH65969.1 hypothetical protein BSPLISOX_346 [uncultured Gammaproteobacteria bacterium]